MCFGLRGFRVEHREHLGGREAAEGAIVDYFAQSGAHAVTEFFQALPLDRLYEADAEPCPFFIGIGAARAGEIAAFPAPLEAFG